MTKHAVDALGEVYKRAYTDVDLTQLSLRELNGPALTKRGHWWWANRAFTARNDVLGAKWQESCHREPAW